MYLNEGKAYGPYKTITCMVRTRSSTDGCRNASCVRVCVCASFFSHMHTHTHISIDRSIDVAVQLLSPAILTTPCRLVKPRSLQPTPWSSAENKVLNRKRKRRYSSMLQLLATGGGQCFYSYMMSEEPDGFQSALVTTTACWLAANWLRYFLAAILSLRGKLGCAVWKLLEVELDRLSLLTASHHYRFHDDCQSTQLCPRWSNTCADCQSSLWFPWWLPVITIVPMMTSSHHKCSHDDF